MKITVARGIAIALSIAIAVTRRIELVYILCGAGPLGLLIESEVR